MIAITPIRIGEEYYYKTLGKDTVHLTRYTGQKALDFIEQAAARTAFLFILEF